MRAHASCDVVLVVLPQHVERPDHRRTPARRARERHLEPAAGEGHPRVGRERRAPARTSSSCACPRDAGRIDLEPDDLDTGARARSRASSSSAVTPLAP
jgi:hypothetical protein